MTIPIIDLHNIHHLEDSKINNDKLKAVIDAIYEASTTSGFFYVINHGISADLIKRQFELTKKLMDLPQDIKDKYEINEGYRGFDKINQQRSDINANPDLKEGFYCGKNFPKDHPYVIAKYHTYTPSQWPVEIPETEQTCQDYIAAMQNLAELIMQLLAKSLGIEENYFLPYFNNPMISLRLLKYPPHPTDADKNTYGVGEHTDWGAITILAQDKLGGLEVKMPNGEWVSAPPLENSFIINLGDMMPRWTNDLYYSNPHRVINNLSKNQARYSIAFFYEPDFLSEIKPISDLIPANEQPHYESCIAGEHLLWRYAQAYQHT